MVHPHEVMTPSDFREYVRDLVKRHSLIERSMGEYLRALWAQVLEHRDEPVTFALLARLLEAAYTATPPPFDPAWLEVEELGWTWDERAGSYVIRSFVPATRTWRILERDISPFRILRHTLLKQISERYLLEEAPHLLTPQERSNLKNLWSNPDPYPYLEAAALALYSEDESEPTGALTWAELAFILATGRVYD